MRIKFIVLILSVSICAKFDNFTFDFRGSNQKISFFLKRISRNRILLNRYVLPVTVGILGCSSCREPIYAFSVESNEIEKIDLNRDNFFDILKLYKTTNTNFHSGDLFEHSVWVAQCIDKWFEDNDEWVYGLSESDRKTAVISGFLHDIGKAGDLNFVYYDKPNHPYNGFLYILNEKRFYKNKKEIFNFDKWFKALNLTSDDRKLIAILVGIHWDFGGKVVKGATAGKSKLKLFAAYIDKLQKLVNESNYNNGIIDERLLRLSILINAADLKGSNQINHCCKFVNLPKCVKKYDSKDMYKKFNMEILGKKLRKELIYFFRLNYSKFYN